MMGLDLFHMLAAVLLTGKSPQARVNPILPNRVGASLADRSPTTLASLARVVGWLPILFLSLRAPPEAAPQAVFGPAA